MSFDGPSTLRLYTKQYLSNWGGAEPPHLIAQLLELLRLQSHLHLQRHVRRAVALGVSEIAAHPGGAQDIEHGLHCAQPVREV